MDAGDFDDQLLIIREHVRAHELDDFHQLRFFREQGTRVP